jgi:pimeloyl-ACP methyl ester carboxylesterase
MSRVSPCLLLAVWFGCLGISAAAAPAVTATYTEVRDVRLYTEIGGNGPPVLFLHGGLRYFDSTFALQKPYFSAFRTVIGVDQRGHGHSPDNDRAFSYAEMAEDTAALLQKLGVGPVDVVGHSDGGNVGLILAYRHPELVRRLVISGANLRGGHAAVLGFLWSLVKPAESAVADTPSPLRDEYARVSPDGVEHWHVVLAKSNVLWATRVVLTPEQVRAIRIPVLVMAGDHDDISLEETIEIYRLLPQGQLLILPASGHETMLERPDEFNRITRAFLDGKIDASARP